MIEIPEAFNLAQKINEFMVGKKITETIANRNPHKFAWFYGNPEDYIGKINGKAVANAVSFGGLVEATLDSLKLVFGDGVNLKYSPPGEKIPLKHQLLLKFEDNSFLTASIRMYGGIWCFKDGDFDNEYYWKAKQKISVFSDDFDFNYFKQIVLNENVKSKSVKAVLATGQNIPGLGNGVLQDILFNAGINPKKKIDSLSAEGVKALFNSVKKTLEEMKDKGGRDTEKDLFGEPGAYKTKMSANTIKDPCPVCGNKIIKEAYMGGSIYYCPNCQKI